MYILDCAGDLRSCCNDYGLANILGIVKDIINLIHIIIPIILMIMLTVQFIQMMAKPDDKKNFKKLTNKGIATVIVFFLPVFANAVVNMITDYDVASCWNNAAELRKELQSKRTIYIKDKNEVSQQIIDNPSDYDKGEKRNTGGRGSNFNYKHLDTYNQCGAYANNMVCDNGFGTTVGASACGLSTFMAVRYALTGKDTDFMSFVHEACRTGLYNGLGSSWEFVERNSIYRTKYGIKSQNTSNSYSSVVKELQKGNVIVLCIQYGARSLEQGGFNSGAGQHFIALIDYNPSNDTIYVYNPNKANTGWTSREKVEKYALKVAALTKLMTKA